jgi:FdhD protein
MRRLPTELRPGAVSLPVQRVKGASVSPAADWVADEVPVALEINGISQAVMLATPLDLADFALGFSITEGLIEGAHQLYDIEELPGPLGITLKLEIAAAAFARLKLRRRSMAGRTGCGLCGTESLGQVARVLPVFKGTSRFTPVAVARAMAAMADQQALQQLTGAVHAAAWCTADGSVCLVREDIGRHNALDKLVGALATAGIDASPGFITVTSRASFEMVQKAAMAGVGLLAAVSAPTAMAVTTATQAGLTLVGFARPSGAVVYSHSRRFMSIVAAEPAHAS